MTGANGSGDNGSSRVPSPMIDGAPGSAADDASSDAAALKTIIVILLTCGLIGFILLALAISADWQ